MVSDHNREPCPDRITFDIGGAFAMGAGGGSVYHFLKGVYNSPKGERFRGGAQAVRMNVPLVGGSFAVWGGLFSAFDCTMVFIRQKEDPWNSIMAGAATGGFLQLRQGFRAASRSALVGGALLALIEGIGIMFSNMNHEPMRQAPLIVEGNGGQHSSPFSWLSGQKEETGLGDGSKTKDSEVYDAPRPSAPSSWFGNIFGSRKEETRSGDDRSKTTVLESFDAPLPPSFDYK